MKKLVLILTTLCLLLSTSIISNGTTRNLPITLYANDQFAYSEAMPVQLNNTFYVPVRTLSDVVGLKLEWDESTQNITMSNDSRTIVLTIDQTRVYVNGFEFKMEAAPALINGRAYVPLDFIAQNFGLNYYFDTQTASLNLIGSSLRPAIAKSTASMRSYTPEDVIWLARIIQKEAGGSSLDGKLGVANVVINRKDSPLFPNTIREVIFAKGQFPPAYSAGFTTLTPSAACFMAAKLALNGNNTVGDSLYFNHVPFAGKANDLYAVIDGQYFYCQ